MINTVYHIVWHLIVETESGVETIYTDEELREFLIKNICERRGINRTETYDQLAIPDLIKSALAAGANDL